MISKFIICSSLLFGLSISAAVPRNEEGELQLVSVLFRHGARTTDTFYANDPYINEEFYPYGLGALTNEGKMGEFKLGQYLKNLYGDFVGEYSEDKVYIRSTKSSRTRISAQLVAAGMFPPNEDLIWNPDLKWFPVSVDYVKGGDEDLFSRVKKCDYRDDALADLEDDKTVKAMFITPYKDLYKYVEENSGSSMSNPKDILDIYFNLKCEADMNYTLPEWTKSVYPNPLDEAGAQMYAFHNYDSELKKLHAGYHLKQILEDYAAKIDGSIDPADRKLFLYSGHEYNLGYMLDALNINQFGIPSYGSAISIELRKVGDEYVIKFRFRDHPDSEVPVDLTIPGCSTLCPIDKFKKLIDDILPTKSVKKACDQKYDNLS